jgi:type IV fimbrial biogenesis protein FimT
MPIKQTGFTLLEVIIAVSIAGILLGIGVPSFVGTIRTNRLAAATNEMISALMYARSEAIKRNVPIVMCRSSDGATCAAANTGGWEIG